MSQVLHVCLILPINIFSVQDILNDLQNKGKVRHARIILEHLYTLSLVGQSKHCIIMNFLDCP